VKATNGVKGDLATNADLDLNTASLSLINVKSLEKSGEYLAVNET
jgi:hypothetical protein